MTSLNASYFDVVAFLCQISAEIKKRSRSNQIFDLAKAIYILHIKKTRNTCHELATRERFMIALSFTKYSLDLNKGLDEE